MAPPQLLRGILGTAQGPWKGNHQLEKNTTTNNDDNFVMERDAAVQQAVLLGGGGRGEWAMRRTMISWSVMFGGAGYRPYCWGLVAMPRTRRLRAVVFGRDAGCTGWCCREGGLDIKEGDWGEAGSTIQSTIKY